jgi:hypothetical protein
VIRLAPWLLAVVSATVLSAPAPAREVIRLLPDREVPVTAAYYEARDGTFRMRFADLGRRVYFRDTMVNERVGWVEMTDQQGVSVFVVSHRLTDGPRDARELDVVRQRYADFSRQLPDRFVDGMTTGRFGRTYTFTLLNANPETGYPVKLGYRPSPTVDAVAVHRFFVVNGTLFELAAVVQRTGAAARLSPVQLGDRATALLDAAVAGFEPSRAPAK